MERRRREEERQIEGEKKRGEKGETKGGKWGKGTGLLLCLLVLCGWLVVFSGFLLLNRIEKKGEEKNDVGKLVDEGWEYFDMEREGGKSQQQSLFMKMKEALPSPLFSSGKEKGVVGGMGKEKSKWVMNLGRVPTGLVVEEGGEETIDGPISYFTPGRENSRRFSILRAKKKHTKVIHNNGDDNIAQIDSFDMLWNTYHSKPTDYVDKMGKDSIRCCILPSEKTSFDILSRSLPDEKAFSFLQIGGGVEYVGARVAAQYPRSTTLSILGSLEEANGAEKFISKYGAHNGYVIQSPLTRQLIHDLWMSVDVFDIVFIADLEGWMGELLPHEMEEVLSEIFMLGREIWVNFPKNSNYFGAWGKGGVGEGKMLKKAGKMMGVEVEVHDEGGGGGRGGWVVGGGGEEGEGEEEGVL